MRILALDQAKSTGYSVFDNSSLIDYGVIELGHKHDVYEGILSSSKNKINKLIKDMNADIIVIEDIQMQGQAITTYKKLAMLMGALICLFQENELLFDIVPPTKWRSFCGIKGSRRIEQKANTIQFVRDKFKLGEISEDEADSIALGWYAVNNLNIKQEALQ